MGPQRTAPKYVSRPLASGADFVVLSGPEHGPKGSPNGLQPTERVNPALLRQTAIKNPPQRIESGPNVHFSIVAEDRDLPGPVSPPSIATSFSYANGRTRGAEARDRRAQVHGMRPVQSGKILLRNPGALQAERRAPRLIKQAFLLLCRRLPGALQRLARKVIQGGRQGYKRNHRKQVAVGHRGELRPPGQRVLRQAAGGFDELDADSN